MSDGEMHQSHLKITSQKQEPPPGSQRAEGPRGRARTAPPGWSHTAPWRKGCSSDKQVLFSSSARESTAPEHAHRPSRHSRLCPRGRALADQSPRFICDRPTPTQGKHSFCSAAKSNGLFLFPVAKGRTLLWALALLPPSAAPGRGTRHQP